MKLIHNRPPKISVDEHYRISAYLQLCKFSLHCALPCGVQAGAANIRKSDKVMRMLERLISDMEETMFKHPRDSRADVDVYYPRNNRAIDHAPLNATTPSLWPDNLVSYLVKQHGFWKAIEAHYEEGDVF